MATKNDITGDLIQSKVNSKAYQDNYDAIFRKKDEEVHDKCGTDQCCGKCPTAVKTDGV